MKWNEVRKHFEALSKKTLAGVIATAMVGTSLAGCGAAAEGTVSAGVEMTEEQTEQGDGAAAENDGEVSALLDTIQENTNQSNEQQGKEETVYIFADSEGNMTSTVVSGWLKNPERLDVLTDQTDALDIFNVKGDETFTKEGSEYRWEANGSDIYYQGTTTKEAPVTEKITYYLDGKEISAKELAGKSGRVKIRFDYENTRTTTAKVNGKEEEIAVPFAVVTGMILNDRFQNISVENGRLVSDGKNNVVIGFALPGLKESLKLDEIDAEGSDEEIRVPDHVEVSADVEDFALDMTLTVATSSADLSFDNALDFSDLDEKIDTLTDASAQLSDGTQELADGIGTLKDSLGEFVDGVASLKDGIVEYTDGAGKLADGISEVKDGADSLDSGAGTLVDGVGTLHDGANTLKDGIDSAASGAKELKDGIDSAKSGAGELKSGIDSAKSGAGELKAGIDSAASGAKALKDGIASAASGADQLDAGINNTLKGGAVQLKDGIAQLKTGINGDEAGNTPGAVNGAAQVAAGVSELSNTLKNQIEGMESQIFQKEADLLKTLYGADVDVTADNIDDYVKGADDAAAQILDRTQGQIAEALLQLLSGSTQKAAEDAKQASYVLGYEAGYADGSKKGEKETNSAAQPDAEGEKNVSADAETETAGDEKTEATPDGNDGTEENASTGDSSDMENGPEEGDSADEQNDKADSAAGSESSEYGDSAEGEASGSDHNSADPEWTEDAGQSDAAAVTTAFSYGKKNRNREYELFTLTAKNQKQYRMIALDGESGEQPGEGNGQQGSAEAQIQAVLKKMSDTAENIGKLQGAIQTLEEMRKTVTGMKGELALVQQLAAGAGELAEGMEKLSEGIDDLYAGAVALEAGIDQLGAGASTLSDGMGTLASGSSELTEGMSRLAGGSSTLTDGMGKLASGSSALSDGMGKLASGSSELIDGMGRLKDGGSQLADGTEELLTGSRDLKDGTQQLKDGAGELADGAKELTDNSAALVDGADELADGSLQVVDGVDELYDGAGELLEGMLEFDKDGIQKIADAYNGDVKSLTDRVKAISDAGSAYDNFCGKQEDTKSSVKFIIRTEPVK